MTNIQKIFADINFCRKGQNHESFQFQIYLTLIKEINCLTGPLKFVLVKIYLFTNLSLSRQKIALITRNIT